MKKRIYLIVLLIIVLFNACEKHEMYEDGDFFYLKSEESKMPIWVKGNKASKTFILFLHGGPEGGSSQYYTIFPSHKEIEEHFAIVYWDQRMCGMSQGNPSMDDASLAQFTSDLDKVVTLINHRYDSPQIFLMGHSWGGALGTNYLLENQSRIKGWIEIDGGHSWTTANAISRNQTIQYAEDKVQNEDDIDFWNFALEWYHEHPTVGINDNAHYTFVGAANGYDYDSESDSLEIPFTELLFYSPISTAYFFVPYQFSFLDKGLDLQDRLNEITIPSLILWGRHDGVFPVSIATDTYEQLGTPEADKRLRIFEYSAHSPNYEEPKSFAKEVIDFIYENN